jgi:hypothetical protein
VEDRIPLKSALNTCRHCGLGIEGDAAAVMEWSQEGAARHAYVPFLEDLRTVPAAVFHPECFSKEHGLGTLLSLIGRRDQIQRLSWFEMSKRIEDLERQLKLHGR